MSQSNLTQDDRCLTQEQYVFKYDKTLTLQLMEIRDLKEENKKLKKENDIWKTRATDIMEMSLNLMKIAKEKDEENEELKETIKKKFW